MPTSPGSTIWAPFSLSNATSGNEQDGTVSATCRRNGVVDSAVSVTIDHLGTGDYVATMTVPTTYSVGDTVSINVVATVGSVTANETVATYVLEPSLSATRTVTQDYFGTDWGTVVDDQGNPIQGASVTIFTLSAWQANGYLASQTASTTTDVSGHWSVSLAPGNYVVYLAYGAFTDAKQFTVPSA